VRVKVKNLENRRKVLHRRKFTPYAKILLSCRGTRPSLEVKEPRGKRSGKGKKNIANQKVFLLCSVPQIGHSKKQTMSGANVGKGGGEKGRNARQEGKKTPILRA